MMKLLSLIIMALLMFGCSAKVEKAETEKIREEIVSKEEAMASLPCFKCHSFKKFSAPFKKGVFSHQVHMDTVHCNQCHEVTGHKPIKLDQKRCGTCHNVRIIKFNKTSLPAKFDHAFHSKTFRCQECHVKVFEMKAGAATILMKDIEDGMYCGVCHNGQKAFSSSECNICHEMKSFNKELVYKMEGFGPVSFSHAFHTAAFSCDDCHPKHFAMKKTAGKMPMDKINEGKFCGACHNGKMAFSASDCEKCHK